MTKPTFYPEWATSDTTLPAAGTGNKERPQEILRTMGFDKGQVATAQEFNWLFDNVYDWIVHLDTTNTTNKTFTLTGDVTGSATYNNEAGWSVTTTVLDNSHNHVSANISDATGSSVPNTVVKRNASGDFSAGTITATLSGNATNAYACSGNSATASKWATARTVSLTGAVTGSASVDGSTNSSITTSYTGFAQTFTESDGGFSLPNGIICKWARITIPSTTAAMWAFATPFPNACLNVQLTLNTNQDEHVFVIEYTKNYITMDNLPGTDDVVCFVTAYGY